MPLYEYALFPTTLGICGLAWRGQTVIGARLPDAHPDKTKQYFETRLKAVEGNPTGVIREAVAAIEALLNGDKTDLSFIHCDLSQVDTFARDVLMGTRLVKAGETATYGSIAADVGTKQDARRVGRALGHNPIPIIVPCHRVLGAGGKLVGFSSHGGIEMKLKMLEIEGAELGKGPGLFDALPLATRSRK